MKFAFDTSGLKDGMAAAQKRINDGLRPGAQAGAQVIYDAARTNVPVSSKGHFFHGTSYKLNGTKYYFEPGSLRDAIYQVYSDRSTEKKAEYHIAWNHQKVPYGFMVEYGTSRAPAHPFLGPAIHDNAQRAQQAMRRAFLDRVQQQ